MKRLPLIVIALTASARLAHAGAGAPIAAARGDVDGDGKPDEVHVLPDGVEVVRAAQPKPQWWPFAASGAVTSATVTIGGTRKAPVIAVMATISGSDGESHEGLALAWKKGALTKLWSGPVGPVGRDDDYDVAIAADASGLARFQTRPDVVRCDGVAPRLYAERWDDASGDFVAGAAEVAVDAKAPTLTASRTAPAVAPDTSVVYRTTAVSSDADAADAGELVAPRELADGNPATAWRSGRDTGEFVTFRSRTAGAQLAGLRIVPGDARAMSASPRVARLAVVTRDRAFWIDVPDADSAAPYWVIFDKPVAADCVSVVFATFHPAKGSKGGAAVSELAVLGSDDLVAGGGDAALVASVVAGGLDGDGAAKQLARRGAGGARAIEGALAGKDVGDPARVRLWLALAAIADPGSAAELGRALSSAQLDDDGVVRVAGGLAAIGAAGQDQLAKVLADADAGETARIGAALVVDDAHKDALVAALGPGPRGLRKAITDRLARVELTWLVDAARQAAKDGAAEREADLWRAVGGAAAATSDAAARTAAIDALAARAGEVSDYERRYRILAALSPLPDAHAIAAVATITAAVGDDDLAAGLRQVAAAGLARSPVPEAAALLATLGVDHDPGVRLAALRGLAGRDDLSGSGRGHDGVDRVLIAGIGDGWPEVRITAAGALALACPRAAPTTALETASDHDAQADVRGAALAALVTCRAPGIGARLLAVAKNGSLSVVVRERAVDLAGALGDPALTAPLVAELKRWRSAAFSDQDALILAQRAAASVGELGAAAHAAGDDATAKSARDALLDTAHDPAFPEIQAAGAAGLGALGAACTDDAHKVLDGLAHGDQATVTQAAKRALATCGK